MSTVHYQLSETWTKVSDGKMGIQVLSGSVHLHFGTETPSEGTLDFHILSFNNPVYPSTFGYTGEESGYMRAASLTDTKVVVTS